MRWVPAWAPSPARGRADADRWAHVVRRSTSAAERATVAVSRNRDPLLEAWRDLGGQAVHARTVFYNAAQSRMILPDLPEFMISKPSM
jgi:hypothetical protein